MSLAMLRLSMCRALLGVLVFAVSLGVSAQPSIPKAGSFDGIPIGELSEALRSKCEKGLCTYKLYQVITDEVVGDVERFLDARPAGARTTFLFASPGGDVRAAISLGRLLRQRAPIQALVPPFTNCESACVLALLGATHRLVGGGVGIHRPYTLSTEQTSLSRRQEYFKSLESMIRGYLSEMNAPVQLLDEMLRYEAESVHFLSKDELSRFRIAGVDLVWQDQEDADMARRYGIDKRTYLQRKLRADARCDFDGSTVVAIERWQNCRAAVLRGDQ